MHCQLCMSAMKKKKDFTCFGQSTRLNMHCPGNNHYPTLTMATTSCAYQLLLGIYNHITAYELLKAHFLQWKVARHRACMYKSEDTAVLICTCSLNMFFEQYGVPPILNMSVLRLVHTCKAPCNFSVQDQAPNPEHNTKCPKAAAVR